MLAEDVREQLEALGETIDTFESSLDKLKSDFVEIKFVILELLSDK